MIWLLATFSSTISLGAPLPSRPPSAVEQAVRESRQQELHERIDVISKSLLGRDYRLDPMGEGVAPDDDPIVQYEAFDCLTYVEEVLSLALSDDTLSVDTLRQNLRYQSNVVTYAKRNHFMELQWIPSAIRQGYLKDITMTIGKTVPVTTDVTASTWARWRHRNRFSLTEAQRPVGTFSLQVLPLAEAMLAVDQFPAGSIVLSVHTPRTNTPTLVSHLGFVVPGTRPTLRHASTLGSKKVQDTPLYTHLRRLQTAYHVWPMLGVVILMPQEQSLRALNTE
jgi:hypothetical protein